MRGLQYDLFYFNESEKASDILNAEPGDSIDSWAEASDGIAVLAHQRIRRGRKTFPEDLPSRNLKTTDPEESGQQ